MRSTWFVTAAAAGLLSGCLLPSFDDLRCDGERCAGDGAGASGGGGGLGGAGPSTGTGAVGPCGADGVSVPRPSGAYCIDAREASLDRYCDFLDAAVGGVSLEVPAVCSWKPEGELAECLTTTGDPCDAIHEVCNDPDRAAGALPAVGMDWCGAATFCLWEGKRLCRGTDGGVEEDELGSEWVYACKPSDAASCHAEGCATWLDATPSATCEGGPSGLFDMIGNVAEWVDNCEGADGADDYCVPRGGDCVSGAPDGCSTVAEARRRSQESATVGLRCCWDP